MYMSVLFTAFSPLSNNAFSYFFYEQCTGIYSQLIIDMSKQYGRKSCININF